jgi:hypothetical protein
MTNWRELSHLDARLAPSTEEILCRQSVLDQINQEIASLERKIEDIQRRKAIYMSYTAPFRCLPTEILSEIATIYLEDYGNITTITQICSRMRDIVFGMVAVWRRIRLVPADTPWGPVYEYTPEVSVSLKYTVLD